MDDLKQMKEDMSTSEVKHESIQQQVFFWGFIRIFRMKVKKKKTLCEKYLYILYYN